MPEEEKPTFPQLVCENCGFVNQLDFNPKVQKEKLSNTMCQSCEQHAYWSYYWRENQLISTHHWVCWVAIMEAIRKRSMRLRDVLHK